MSALYTCTVQIGVPSKRVSRDIPHFRSGRSECIVHFMCLQSMLTPDDLIRAHKGRGTTGRKWTNKTYTIDQEATVMTNL